MLDHDGRSLALIARVFDRQSEGLTRDDILDNISTYSAILRRFWYGLGIRNSPKFVGHVTKK
jgi:hypothetical protein